MSRSDWLAPQLFTASMLPPGAVLRSATACNAWPCSSVLMVHGINSFSASWRSIFACASSKLVIFEYSTFTL